MNDEPRWEMKVKCALPWMPKSARPKRVTWVDIETRKVECEPILRESGEVIRKKWEPILIGAGYFADDGFWIEMTWGWEGKGWSDTMLEMKLDSDEMIYCATREFDEMVLKGRFTNARRAHLPKRPKEWEGIEESLFAWRNIRREMRPAMVRGVDVESRLVPEVWPEKEKEVLVHLFRDVLDLVVRDPMTPELDEEAKREVEKLMTNFEECWKMIVD